MLNGSAGLFSGARLGFFFCAGDEGGEGMRGIGGEYFTEHRSLNLSSDFLRGEPLNRGRTVFQK